MNRSKTIQALAAFAVTIAVGSIALAAYGGGFTYTATVPNGSTSTFALSIPSPAKKCVIRNLDASHDIEVKVESPYPSTGTANHSDWLHLEHPADGMPEHFAEIDTVRDLGMDSVEEIYMRTTETGYTNDVDVTVFCTLAD